MLHIFFLLLFLNLYLFLNKIFRKYYIGYEKSKNLWINYKKWIKLWLLSYDGFKTKMK